MAEQSPATGKRPEAAVALRIAGATFADIATHLGYADAASAQHAVERALAAKALDEEKRANLRELEGARLDRLLRGLWAKAVDADSVEQISATRTALAIIDRRIRLYGLDAPARVEVYTPAQSELEAWVAAMTTTAAAAFGVTEGAIIEGEVISDEQSAIDE